MSNEITYSFEVAKLLCQKTFSGLVILNHMTDWSRSHVHGGQSYSQKNLCNDYTRCYFRNKLINQYITGTAQLYVTLHFTPILYLHYFIVFIQTKLVLMMQF